MLRKKSAVFWVGMLRINYSWLPSVESCVNNSYDFWINDPKSFYKEYYKKGNADLVYNLICSVRNEYYDWSGKDKIQPVRDGKIGLASYLTNGYSRTFFDVTQYTTYEIERKDEVIEKERKKILLVGGIIISVVFLSFLIYLLNKYSKKEKEKNLSLYEKLKTSCNPVNFMKPYDEKKVEKANAIFEQLMLLNGNQIEELKELRRKAINELDISFVNNDVITELKEKCNPKKFVNPYNAEKIRIANVLYNKLLTENINIEEIEEIEKEINETL